MEDVAGLAHHIGQAAEAVLHLAHGHGGMRQRCTGEGGVGLEQVEGVAQVIHGVAQLVGSIAQLIETILDAAAAVIADPVLDVVHDVVGDAAHAVQRVRGFGQSRSQLGVVGGRDGLGSAAHDAAHLGGNGRDGADGTCDLGSSTGNVTVVGQEGRRAQQAHACGDGLHCRGHAAAQREDAGHGVGHLQQLNAGLEVLVGLLVRGQGVVCGEDAGDGLRGSAVIAGIDRLQQLFDTLRDSRHTVTAILGRVAHLVQTVAGLGQGSGCHQHLSGHLAHGPLEVSGGVGQLGHGIFAGVHDGFEFGEGIGQQSGGAVDLVGHLVAVVAGLIVQLACRCNGGVHLAGHGAEGIGDAGGGVLDDAGGVIDKAAQNIQLRTETLDGVLGEVEFAIGFRLTGDAAHVLAAQNMALIDTAGYEAVGAAHDAAHVVANMLVADGAGVDAGQDHAGGAACDAAGVGGDVGDGIGGVVIGGGHLVVDLVHHLGGEAVGVERGFLIFGVDAAHVGAAGDGAEVVACDAAGGRFAGDDGAGRAVVDGAFGLVAAHNAAHLAVAGDDAGELAADEGTVVDAYDAAGGGVGRVRDRHDTADAQGLDGALFLHDAEEARRGILARNGQVRDGVAIALELSAEGRDGLPQHPLEGEVFL